MGPPRKRNVSEPDQYDITDGFDEEEKQGFATRDSSLELDRIPDSPASSRDAYGSRDAMLRNTKRDDPPPMRRPSSSPYHYRIPNRTMRWLCIALMSTIVLFILVLFRMSHLSSKHAEQTLKDKPPPPPPWESFGLLERYYGGIRTLVSRQQNVPEFPAEDIGSSASVNASKAGLSASHIMSPYPDYGSEAYVTEYGPVRECYLDEDDSVRVPQVQSYTGVTQGFPDAVVGSYAVMGIPDSICYDRYGKLGPYGYGYSSKRGGVGAGLDGEREGADNVWKQRGQVDYRKVRWSDAQRRCLERNQHRFSNDQEDLTESFREMRVGRAENNLSKSTHTYADSMALKEADVQGQSHLQIPRTAVVIRIWTGFVFTQETTIYLRSLIAELSLLSSGEYTVHFLIHVKDDNAPIWSDDATYAETLKEALPEEFRGMGTLWSERQMNLIYGGLEETFYRDLSVHGVYRSAHLPLQYFARKHTEYAFFWNWEMDVRYTGHWYQLFESLRKFARDQPRKGLWERSGRFYIPSVHGSWEDFKHMVRVQSEMPLPPPSPSQNKWANAGPPEESEAPAIPDLPVDQRPVWGPRAPDELFVLETDQSPPTTYDKDKYSWGIGEEADFITLNPLFDPHHTTWLLAEDVTGYNLSGGHPPRRAAIITASRLSRRLLDTMHSETALRRHTMFSEMWPASCALHHGLKAVYAPHPVYVDRRWPVSYLAKTFNNGLNGATGGSRTSVFGLPEHNLLGVTWYYNSGFSQNFWKRWLGFRVNNDGGEEEELEREGRMCVPAVLLHPVRDIDLLIEEQPASGS